MNTTTKRRLFILFVLVWAVLIFNFARVVITAETISLTLPPWDFCGWHETKAGTAFDCIAYDVDVTTLK